MENKDNKCTLFPDGVWSKCCEQHDEQYEKQEESKFRADLDFSSCVFKKVKEQPFESILSLISFVFLIIYICFSYVVAMLLFALVFIGVSTVGIWFWYKAKHTESKKEQSNVLKKEL